MVNLIKRIWILTIAFVCTLECADDSGSGITRVSRERTAQEDLTQVGQNKPSPTQVPHHYTIPQSSMYGEELERLVGVSKIKFHDPDANGNITKVDIIDPHGDIRTLTALSFRQKSEHCVRMKPFNRNERTVSIHDLIAQLIFDGKHVYGEELERLASLSSFKFHEADANGNITQVDIIDPYGDIRTLTALSFKETWENYVEITPLDGNVYRISTHDLIRVGLRIDYGPTSNKTNRVTLVSNSEGSERQISRIRRTTFSD